jgi:hypothetical protein
MFSTSDREKIVDKCYTCTFSYHIPPKKGNAIKHFHKSPSESFDLKLRWGFSKGTQASDIFGFNFFLPKIGLYARGEKSTQKIKFSLRIGKDMRILIFDFTQHTQNPFFDASFF